MKRPSSSYKSSAKRTISPGPSLPAWATRGLAILLLVGGAGIPWWATWQGVLRRRAPPLVIPEPTVLQYRPELVLIPGGTFYMGSTDQALTGHSTRPAAVFDEHHHRATVAALYVCRTEVTRRQWRSVMREPPSTPDDESTDDLPVAHVTWYEACLYTNKLTELENILRNEAGKPPLSTCYTATRNTCAWTTPECTGFRLPTETEWEYFARAGTTSEYWFGDNPGAICDYGNGLHLSSRSALDCDDTHPDLAPAISFPPNPWGFFNVHGNISEWTWDRYQNLPDQDSSAIGFAGPTGEGARVTRGGSFNSFPFALRSAYRSPHAPESSDLEVGLRCVRSMDEP